MKRDIIFLWVFFFAFLSFLHAQEYTITGTVTDSKNIPLPGVTVLNKQSQSATQTDLEGNYHLKGKIQDRFVFSFLGMKIQEHKIVDLRLNVQLVEEAIELEGIVVTALGITRNKRSLGYSTQQLTGDLQSPVGYALKAICFFNS